MEDYKKLWDLTRDVREEYIRDLNREIDRLKARGFPEPETATVYFKLKSIEELTLREISAIENEQLSELREALSRVGFPLS